ncbi:MAG TPA: trypsin-like peptidase domain-containing protein [candidate division Zixibacteria bacterium]|nr:trypsin-like peptidase domain-containing protein [candidate division Zixibacteria bacterium]
MNSITYKNGPIKPENRQPIPEQTDSVKFLDSFSQAVTGIVECVTPAVVSINVRSKITRRNRVMRQGGAGSGALFTPDGYILTNSHVVHEAESIEVVFSDGTTSKAVIIGADSSTDLAVIRVQSSSLPYLTLGNSSALKVGQLVIAIGNPLGFDSTVSTGVVSALGRALQSQDGRTIENIIQHTAPLNPGNSGGPLTNTKGEIVGINTAIIAMAQGIGFAIPSNTASFIVSQLLAHGRVRRGRLGIVGQDRPLSTSLVRFHNLPHNRAVEVIDIDQKAPAAKAGIQKRDIIVGVNNQEVITMTDLQRFLTEKWQPGQSITASIIRSREKLAIELMPIEA